MDSKSDSECDICGSSLFPNNVGKIIKNDSKEEFIKICKTCNKTGEIKSEGEFETKNVNKSTYFQHHDWGNLRKK